MTFEQANWASKHDWFIKMNESCDGVSYTVTVSEVMYYKDQWTRDRELVFTSYQELRNWAGY